MILDIPRHGTQNIARVCNVRYDTYAYLLVPVLQSTCTVYTLESCLATPGEDLDVFRYAAPSTKRTWPEPYMVQVTGAFQ